jgi:hypothetical protein
MCGRVQRDHEFLLDVVKRRICAICMVPAANSSVVEL